jgi:hypothetical protein
MVDCVYAQLDDAVLESDVELMKRLSIERQVLRKVIMFIENEEGTNG